MAIYTMKEGIVDKAVESLLGCRTGISTGFKDLDRYLEGGFQEGYLYVLGARPVMGKTSLALSMAANMCKSGKKVLYYSLGLNAENLSKRLIMILAGDNKDEYEKTADQIKDYRMVIDDSPNAPVEIIGNYTCDGIVIDDAEIIIIDYLQLLDVAMDWHGTDADFDHVKYSRICTTLKELAWKKRIPIVLLSQLSRTLEKRPRHDRRPRMVDLHEYNKVAELADVVMFLYRDEYYYADTELKGIAEVIVSKNVTGVSGTCRLANVGYGRYYPIFAEQSEGWWNSFGMKYGKSNTT